jgi:hypothetical protein
MLQHGTQVLEIEQQPVIVVGNFEDQRKHAFLGFVEIQQATEQ